MSLRVTLFLLFAGFALPLPSERVVNGQASAADTAVFPLKVSTNGRYLVDQGNTPFFIHGDSPWSLIAQLSQEDAGRYLERVQKQGFTAIIVNLVEHAFSDNAPRNHAGDAPFTTPGDFSTPNEAYFAHADRVLGKAREKGLLVLLFPAWAAGPGGKGGWNQEILSNGPEKCRAFGRYVGDRYKDFPNIIWGHGGDQNPAPDSPMARNLLEILLGIKDAAPKQMHFYHGMRAKTSLDQENFASHVDLDAVYVADEARGAARVGESHTTSLRAYNREKFKPLFLFEGVYESVLKEKPKWGDPYTSDRARLRRQVYWNLLSGSTGHFYGNFPAWALASGWDGPDGLGSPGYRDMQRLREFVTSHAWWKLVPDDKHLTVTKGYGRFKEADYVTGARADDGSLVLAYLPSTGTQPRALTVDLTKLRAAVTARWFNPSDGQYTSISGAPFAATSSREFTTPGDNGTGANDWVLVLTTAAVSARKLGSGLAASRHPAAIQHQDVTVHVVGGSRGQIDRSALQILRSPPSARRDARIDLRQPHGIVEQRLIELGREIAWGDSIDVDSPRRQFRGERLRQLGHTPLARGVRQHAISALEAQQTVRNSPTASDRSKTAARSAKRFFAGTTRTIGTVASASSRRRRSTSVRLPRCARIATASSAPPMPRIPSAS